MKISAKIATPLSAAAAGLGTFVLEYGDWTPPDGLITTASWLFLILLSISVLIWAKIGVEKVSPYLRKKVPPMIGIISFVTIGAMLGGATAGYVAMGIWPNSFDAQEFPGNPTFTPKEELAGRTIIDSEVLRLTDVLTGFNRISGKTFTNCEIYGPAVVWGWPGSIIQNNVLMDGSGFLPISSTPEEQRQQSGGLIILENTRIVGSRLHGILFVGSQQDIDAMTEDEVHPLPDQGN